MNKLDLEAIWSNATLVDANNTERLICIASQKEAIKAALPLILEHVAENAEVIFKDDDGYGYWVVDKKSITSQGEEILKMLGIDK